APDSYGEFGKRWLHRMKGPRGTPKEGRHVRSPGYRFPPGGNQEVFRDIPADAGAGSDARLEIPFVPQEFEDIHEDAAGYAVMLRKHASRRDSRAAAQAAFHYGSANLGVE